MWVFQVKACVKDNIKQSEVSHLQSPLLESSPVEFPLFLHWPLVEYFSEQSAWCPGCSCVEAQFDGQRSAFTASTPPIKTAWFAFNCQQVSGADQHMILCIFVKNQWVLISVLAACIHRWKDADEHDEGYIQILCSVILVQCQWS